MITEELRNKDHTMKNRYGNEYHFEQIDENTYTIVGDLKYWRYGGLVGQEEMNFDNLGFVDPSGGPFIELGSQIEGRTVIGIRAVADKIYFRVENS
jgi:hypothetical protein